MLILRPYQSQLVDAIRYAFRRSRRVLAVAPTGSGKTVIFSRIGAGATELGNRAYFMAHRIEIIDQIGHALEKWNVRYGYVAPGYPESPALAQVAMVQSLARRTGRYPAPKLLVIDEAHHGTAGSYRTVVDAWPGARILGVTATPARTDGRGLGDLFDVLIEGPTMGELIARGYLSAYRYFCPPQVVNLNGVASRAGDYAQDQLAEAMNTRSVTGDAVQHYARHLAGKPAIAFCVSVEHAEAVAAQFREAGWRAASVDGSMAKDERKRRIRGIGNGDLQVLTSCDVVSEGTDIPAVAGALLLRPTQSLIVYLQQVGRVLRLKADGSHAVILDHVGNVMRHGMPDAAREWSLEGRKLHKQARPVRQCPACYACFAPAPKCPECGHVFAAELRRELPRAAAPGELVELKKEDVARRKLATIGRAAAACETLEDFQLLARQFGYKPGWAWMQFLRRKRKEAAA